MGHAQRLIGKPASWPPTHSPQQWPQSALIAEPQPSPTRSTEQWPRSCSTCACSARCFQPRGAKVAWEPSAQWQEAVGVHIQHPPRCTAACWTCLCLPHIPATTATAATLPFAVRRAAEQAHPRRGPCSCRWRRPRTAAPRPAQCRGPAPPWGPTVAGRRVGSSGLGGMATQHACRVHLPRWLAPRPLQPFGPLLASCPTRGRGLPSDRALLRLRRKVCRGRTLSTAGTSCSTTRSPSVSTGTP